MFSFLCIFFTCILHLFHTHTHTHTLVKFIANLWKLFGAFLFCFYFSVHPRALSERERERTKRTLIVNFQVKESGGSERAEWAHSCELKAGERGRVGERE